MLCKIYQTMYMYVARHLCVEIIIIIILLYYFIFYILQFIF